MTPRTPVAWPDGTRRALCLTFDLDGPTMWTSRDPSAVRRPSVVSHGVYDVEEGLVNVLDFLDRNGISCTFFVPSDVAAAYPQAVQEIVRRGHEVGSHGTDHVPLSVDASAEQETELIQRSTELLEDVAQVRPVGYRAPLYSVTDRTWSILAGLGYRYSSNLMDSIHPYQHPEGIVEVPVQWVLDDGLYFLVSYHPPNYRVPRAAAEVASIWLDELRGVGDSGGALTMTLHPQLVGRPSRIGILQELVDSAVELGDFWFPRLVELSDHVSATAEPVG